MEFQEGYVYHIKDAYFAKAQDDKLMQNKENGSYRPTFFCMEDQRVPGLLWVVPMSTRIEKFQILHDKQAAQYGKCLTIVIGKFDGRKSAFLLQNMFPITQQYLDHIHTRNGNPVPVKHTVAQEVRSNLQQLRQLIYKGKRVVFPDVKRLEKIMVSELLFDKEKKEEVLHTGTAPAEKSSIKDRLAAAQVEAKNRTGDTAAFTAPRQAPDFEKE